MPTQPKSTPRSTRDKPHHNSTPTSRAHQQRAAPPMQANHSVVIPDRETERETDTDTETDTDREKETDTDRERDRHTDTQTDRERDTQRDRETERERERHTQRDRERERDKHFSEKTYRKSKSHDDVHFLRKHSSGQYFVLIHDIELIGFGCPDSCREPR